MKTPTVYDRMQILRNDITVGRELPDLRRGEENRFFQGADLVLTDVPIKAAPHHVVVVTPYAEELSKLVFALQKIGDEVIDCFNKYEFYPALGEAALRAMAKPGASCRDILFAMLDAADGFFYQYEETGYPDRIPVTED